MIRAQIEHRLRHEPFPEEPAYLPRPLPATLAEARQRVGRRGGTHRLFATTAGMVALGAAVVLGLAWVGVLDGRLPAGSGVGPLPSPVVSTTPAPTASASPSAVPAETACAPADFAVTTDAWGAAAGSRGTVVVLRVVDSVAACSVDGSLAARITDATGAALVTGASQPMTGVRLTGGTQVEVGIAWSNWCGAAPEEPLQLGLTLPGTAQPIPVVPPSGSAILVPPCLGSGQPSALSVTDLQPSTRPRTDG